MGVENANTKLHKFLKNFSNDTDVTDPAKIYFTTCYSGWNVHPQLRLWVRTTKHAM